MGREVDVRAQVHGHPAHDVRHRRGRPHRKDIRQGRHEEPLRTNLGVAPTAKQKNNHKQIIKNQNHNGRESTSECGQAEGLERSDGKDRKGLRQGVDHADEQHGSERHPGHPDGLDHAGHSPGRGRIPQRPRHRNLRSRIVGQDDAGDSCDCRSAKGGRHSGVHRRGTRIRQLLCPETGRRCGQPADFAAGQRRTSARNRRFADSLERHRHHCH